MLSLKLAGKVLGFQLLLYSLSLLSPIVVSLIYQDNALLNIIYSLATTLILGSVLLIFCHREKGIVTAKSSFILVASFWLTLGFIGSFPFYFGSTYPTLSFVDAVFESFSGLTTTGATVIPDLEQLPKSILFYRQQLQWFGGMGIVVLSISILPMLGIGGINLYKSEMPGSFKTYKPTPKIAETAKILWLIYFLLTCVCALCYWLAGMSVFDAICHSFSTVSLGGFSTHNESIAYFNSPLIEVIAIAFMLICAINFALHFLFWNNKSPLCYFQDHEFRFYVAVLAIITTTVVLIMFSDLGYGWVDSVRYGVFQAISITTTTGFATADFSSWGKSLPYLLFLGCFVGGCIGSTGGGLKSFRILMILKQSYLEIRRLINPNAVFFITIDGQKQTDRVMQSIWGFFSIYIIVFIICFIFMLITGLDPITALSSVAATINNLGPGLGEVAVNYHILTDLQKLALSFVMVLGRLEIFTLLVIFTPAFWRF